MAPAGIAPPTGPAGPTALEAHERVGGHAATRQSVLVRAVIASYTQPTQIEIPIPCETWHRALVERDAARDADIAAQAARSVLPVNALALSRAVDEQLQERSTVVADGGDFIGSASYVVRPRAPMRWLDPGVFGTLGVGAGFAMAAKIVRPDDDVWLLWGDGAAGYGAIELDTFVRHELPIICVIGNDGAWTQIAREQVPMLGDDVATQIGRTRFHELAESLGATGILLDDASRVADTVRRARDLSREGRVVLVNAQIGVSEFRKGSLAM